MIQLNHNSTIGQAFREAVRVYGHNWFLMAPKNEHRKYHPDGYAITYLDAGEEVDRLITAYSRAGYGSGHRVGLDLENRPEHFFHKIALNSLGVCCVPLNCEYRENELLYVIEHSRPDLIVAASNRICFVKATIGDRIPICLDDDVFLTLSSPTKVASDDPVSPSMPASILYTSGTTGRPKGCVLSHSYELESGAWYLSRGGVSTFKEGGDRLYNPLPLYHVNASVFSFFCILLAGNCQIQGDRFHPNRWWKEVNECEATVVHYLGVIVPMLLGQGTSDLEKTHKVRFGIGAGVEATLHQKFEERFGFPLVEVWGMTEVVGGFFDNASPRSVGTRAVGKVPSSGLEARIVDANDSLTPSGATGELTVRYSEATPRRRFFSEYLDDPIATEDAWRGGWFHTGDLVRQTADGVIHFVDRNKNIIRRSGENIAAAEIEEVLQSHPLVRQATVIAVKDEIREEEVYACIVLKSIVGNESIAKELFVFCVDQLSYFKAPGYIWFTNEIPKSGTQKVQKYLIFKTDSDPREAKGVFDFRSLKTRNANARQAIEI
ncbi:crotonobetaine/carnitine-CoA ligase [Polaromonas sp. OV174]|uniref:AMP-binding protein n=1 Tax=Polaromonas sp. OV174 TaxID=1855300 RepID=UPI0008F43D70|nr:AMP-binding protein [Polaromonas sp. OV174]SFC52373.1 crotonobetaine/carnitine-CoA ligase [Polaromonas sp. OV174]